MTKLAVLNNVDHKDLKINTSRSAELGDAYMCVPTFPKEFRSVQAHYPIVFGKNAQSEEYTPLVLLGLQENENLFLRDGEWDARYLPLCAEAKPFLIGPGQNNPADDEQQWVIHVDMDSPKLGAASGVSLFKEFGGNSDYLDRVREVLQAIHEGIAEVKPFTDLLEKYELLEPFSAETQLINRQTCRLEGFYTINEERLANLPAEDISHLHSSGFLFDIHMQLASLSHLADLFDRKNAQLS
jgi:hypothetical protein